MEKKMQTMDGNTAAAYVSYAFTDVAAIFPITPSSSMAEHIDEWSANGKKNIFGQNVLVTEMQSEGGAAGAVHGSLTAGALTTTYTSSQGLLLMIPNMYKIAGELLPGVFHVAARALSSHALSIFGDHQDVMSARQTGFALLSSCSVQEVMDLGAVAHLSAIKGSVPFMHYFDGFRTSHEVQKIELLDYGDLAKLTDMDAVDVFRNRSLNPERPVTKGTAQNPDIYFQSAEASNKYYENIVGVTEEYMNNISDLTGRDYKLFNYYGAADAERVIVAMGSVCETIEETVDYMNANGEKAGLVKVRLYRPFSMKHFLSQMPKTVKKIAVLDRTKEKGAIAEPLHLDVIYSYSDEAKKPVIVGGRYGLASKDVTPSQIYAVYENLKLDKPNNRFTIGIEDDVTYTSLPIKETIKTGQKGTIKCKFWGFGSDGTVGANKSAIKIIGDNTDKYVQAYFAYDSKKSGGVTISHLRFGGDRIKSTYQITDADFTSCSKQSYVFNYDLLSGLKKNGVFLLNTIWGEKELDKKLPAKMKIYIYENNIKFYTINATRIASEIGLESRTNMIMQSAFFKLAEVIPIEDAVKHMKDSIIKDYGAKGEKIVNMNFAAVDKGIAEITEIAVKKSWKDAVDEEKSKEKEKPDFVKNILEPMNRQEGDELPVSVFLGEQKVRGEIPSGMSAYEKRGVAVEVPKWIPENCIQCNQCSLVCPHAAIRPFLLDNKEYANNPEAFITKKAIGKGLENYAYRMQVSVMDCVGCNSCANICPAKEKALVMVPFEGEKEKEAENWNYAIDEIKNKEIEDSKFTVKGSQFNQPLLEFSGACAGCGETPYSKLVTQLYGDRMLVANASGCSSIWGGSSPSSTFCKNQEGKGPAWASSLFEDNAEFGYGMAVATRKMREKIQLLMEEYIKEAPETERTKNFVQWIATVKNPEENKAISNKIIDEFKTKEGDAKLNNIVEQIEKKKDYLIKKSVWITGGDGWAYDIGYGGVDHVLALGEDINIMVFDTEVYSNTGGQSSKSTPIAAVAKFASAGKRLRKKDLGMIAIQYGYVYVAQIALGADMNQTIKALKEAESYDGPSLIICYTPCVNHGLRAGMGKSIAQEKNAVETGYWYLYRFDPRLEEEGKNPFHLDSKEPNGKFMEFLNSEVRYTSLKKKFPEIADELYAKAEQAAKDKYERYKKMAER